MEKITTKLITNIQTDIFIDNGISKKLSSILEPKSEYPKFIIITDKNVFSNYRDYINQQFNSTLDKVIILDGGELNKSFDSLTKIYSDLIKFGCNKKTCLIALGGGVISDITGFVASTFMRGIRYVNIPTTLLSMVDSSIGGKTGINLSNGKNLIGSIYHPEKIIIDPDILKTLPLREYHSGMAEIIKYGLILDKNLFEKLEENLDILLNNNQKSKILKEIIINCINLKINIVQQDEKDNNIRNILNFGHTIGHALEAFFPTDYIRHGEAIGYGMIYASKLSKIYNTLNDKDFKRIINIISKLDLPKLNNMESDKILKFIKTDKKNTDEGLKFILLDEIGVSRITKNISFNNIKMVLEDYEYISY